MQPLEPYFAEQALKRVRLKDSLKRRIPELLGLMDADGRINVAAVHDAIYPDSTTASANAALNRLLREINQAASKQGFTLRVEITRDKKAGAKLRWIWFEGPPPTPPLARTDELDAIPPGRLVTDTRGIPAGDLPVVVLLTFNEHETHAVIRRFHPSGRPDTATRNDITYNHLGVHGGLRVLHRVSRQGEGEAQNAAHDAIAAWRPRALIGVGIAFGVNPSKQRIGDVLVSETVRGYELTRVNADGSITPRGDKPPASQVLLNRFDTLKQNLSAHPDACMSWPMIRIGCLLSGNKLVDNIDYRGSLLSIEQEAIGGEMEAIGIQLAAQRHDVHWIIVKAICDWGDGNKHSTSKDQDQQLAAKHAAMVVHAALNMGGLYRDTGPHANQNANQNANRPRSSDWSPDSTPDWTPDCPQAAMMGLGAMADLPVLIEDQRGQRATLAKDADLAQARQAGAAQSDDAVDTLDYLMHWLDDADAPALFALLGEYGMGKTVTCQRFAKALDDARRGDPTRPLPLYLDLRHVTGLDKRVPTLPEIVSECIARGWDQASLELPAGDDGGRPGFSTFLDWVRLGAVVIFDGLDEVLVKLREADGQVFTAELLRLPELVRAAATKADSRSDSSSDRSASPARLLISCRTHYFRTLRDQQNHFTGQERGGLHADAYRALILLPLTDEQVRRYLTEFLPGTDADALLETIAQVHNLGELTQRPYTLRLVAEFIPDIEQDRIDGRPVYGVTLYRRMVRRWLERDGGKHHIRPQHKLRLAAHLALHLWRRGAGLLPAQDIEDWFHAWLESEPSLHRRYRDLHPDQLEEDLRTATFLTRLDRNGDGDDGSFRFAHTSLLEFFLADALLGAIRDNAPQRWAIPRPSPETLDFLGQMLAEQRLQDGADGLPALLQTLQDWRTSYRPETSELLLAYALRAQAEDWPMPELRGIVLTGARLDEWQFRCESAAQGALDLSQADFSGCNLRRALFNGVRLRGARFNAAILEQTEFLGCDARGADWSQTRCSAALFRDTRLEACRWNGATGAGPSFLRCDAARLANQADRQAQPAEPELPDFAGLRIAPLARASESVPGCTHPPLRLLSGHQGWVRACAFSPDGRRLLSAGVDGTVRLWDAESGQALRMLLGHQGWVWSCAFSPDGRRLLSAGEDGTVRLWDAESGQALRMLLGHQGLVWSCAFSPDGRRLLSAGDDGTVRLWDAESGQALRMLSGHRGSVRSCAFSPDGRRLLSAGVDGTVRLWDAESGEALRMLSGHQGWVWSCAFSPDGRRLLSAGDDGTVRLWDAESGQALRMLSGHQGSVQSCAFSPDGRRLLSAGDDGTVRLWDAESGQALRMLSGHQGWVWSCAFSPDGRRLLSAGEDGTVRLWDAESGQALRMLSGHQGLVRSCAFSPDGRRLLSAGDDGTVRLWDAESGQALRMLSGHQGLVWSCAFSPDGRRLLSAGVDGTVRLWDAESGQALRMLLGHQGLVWSCAFSPDGRRLLSAGEDGTVRLWDAGSSQALRMLSDHQGEVLSCAFSPDGRRLLSAGLDGTVRLWDAESGQALRMLSGHQGLVRSCAFSPDGRRLLSAGDDGTVRLWDAESGEALRMLSGHQGWVWSCAFSPDGRRLLSAGVDGTVRLWDAESGQALRLLSGHQGWVESCAFSTDGRRLLSAGDDGTMRLWDAESGMCLRIHASFGRRLAGQPQRRLEGGHAVWEPADNRLIEATGDAWRWLAWVDTGADGWPQPLPLETFGPMPEPKRLQV